MKKIVLLSLLAIPAIVLANSGHGEGASHYLTITGRESDYLPRVVNFIIFASLLYYLLANPIKNFFSGRSQGILGQLKEIESKLKDAKDADKEAQLRLEESLEKAEEILSDAKKEAKILADKIAETAEAELLILEKQYEEKMALEERKTLRAAIDEVLNENILSEDIAVDEAKVVDIIAKKVA